MTRFWCISILVLLFLYSCESEIKKQEPVVEILSPQQGDVYFTSDTVPIKLKIVSLDCDIHHHITKVEVDREDDNITKLSSYDYIWHTSRDDEGYHMIDVTVFSDCSQSASAKRQIQIIACDLPTVLTGYAFAVTDTSTKICGFIGSDGGCPIIERGFYFGSQKYKVNSDSTYFETEITGLSEATFYYYSAYAINALGETVGATTDVQTNHKKCNVSVILDPSLFYTVVTDSTISSSYYVEIDDNCWYFPGSIYTGIYYSTSPDPFNTGFIMPLESIGPGLYNFYLDNLQPETDYYIKAFCWNINMKGESEEVVYRTIATQ